MGEPDPITTDAAKPRAIILGGINGAGKTTEFDRTLADNTLIQAALLRAAQDAALTHARLGRAIPEWREGKIVDVTPAEIFARYGLDEFGRPKAESPDPR